MRGSPAEVFAVFLRLGATSFGGPIAHLGYFREELVARRGWLRDDEYGDLVALCQVLPGPTSSQVGFALGLRRAGFAGALAAFLAFTLPSAVLMVALGLGARLIAGPVATGAIDGLMIVAVAVVAHAVWGMARTLAPDRPRAAIAVAAGLVALLLAGTAGQLAALGVGVVAGSFLLRRIGRPPTGGARFAVPRGVAIACLAGFLVLIAGLPLAAALTRDGSAALVDAFFRAGSLVFGGGHVVLPLLDAEVAAPGWVSPEQFLVGYGAAQAMPGPLFTFAGYLGAVATTGPGGVAGGALALAAIFLPGFLLLVGALPFWDAFCARPWSGPALAGANAAVVGILAAALYTPVFTTAVTSPASFGLAAVCLVLLARFRVAPWLVVIVGAAGGVGLSLAGG